MPVIKIPRRRGRSHPHTDVHEGLGMMEFAVKGASEKRTNKRKRRREARVAIVDGRLFLRSRKFAGESPPPAQRASRRALHLLGALIQYLINSILSQSRDLAYSRGRAASILRAVASGGDDTWRPS